MPKRNDLADPIFEQAIANLKAKQKPIEYMPDNPVKWIQDYFVIPRDETPTMRLELGDYQIKALNHALSRDAKGRFKYGIILWSDIKKSAKSSLAAAVILWRAWHTEYAQFYVIANDLKQADSRVAMYLRRAIELHPELSKVCKIKPSGYSIELPNHSRIESIPVDPSGEAGSNAMMTEWTELWGATSDAASKMWTEMTSPPNLFGRSLRWVETYAGFEGESNLLFQLYQTGVTHGQRIDDEYPFYVNPSARMFTMWNETPRLPWQTQEYYDSERAILTPSEFNRVHRNIWSTSSNAFVPAAWWEACRGEIPPYKGESCVIGIDAAVVDDCFAIVMLSKSMNKDEYVIRYSRKWSAPNGGKIDFAEPEAELRRLCQEHSVIQLTYDSYQLESLAMQLTKDGVGYFYSFSQGAKRLIADKQLYDSIRDRRIVHNGDVDMTEHILNANASTVTGHIDQLRLVKRQQHLKIDLAVALSMSLSEAQNFNLP